MAVFPITASLTQGESGQGFPQQSRRGPFGDTAGKGVSPEWRCIKRVFGFTIHLVQSSQAPLLEGDEERITVNVDNTARHSGTDE